jgi:hypothetical protein
VPAETAPGRAFLRCLDFHGGVLAELELPQGTEWTQLVQVVHPGADAIHVVPVIEDPSDLDLYRERYRR